MGYYFELLKAFQHVWERDILEMYRAMERSWVARTKSVEADSFLSLYEISYASLKWEVEDWY